MARRGRVCCATHHHHHHSAYIKNARRNVRTWPNLGPRTHPEGDEKKRAQTRAQTHRRVRGFITPIKTHPASPCSRVLDKQASLGGWGAASPDTWSPSTARPSPQIPALRDEPWRPLKCGGIPLPHRREPASQTRRCPRSL